MTNITSRNAAKTTAHPKMKCITCGRPDWRPGMDADGLCLACARASVGMHAPMTDAERHQRLNKLGVSPAARWAWDDAAIRRAEAKAKMLPRIEAR